jgi:hypothetical protein
MVHNHRPGTAPAEWLLSQDLPAQLRPRGAVANAHHGAPAALIKLTMDSTEGTKRDVRASGDLARGGENAHLT